MRKSSALLAVLLFLGACRANQSELEKLRAENGKLKDEVQRLAGEVRRLENASDEIVLEKKYRQALADMRTIGNALEAYIADYSKLPEGNSLMELAYNPGFVPFYIKAVPYLDPWEKEYYYQKGAGGRFATYWIGCAGSDGVFNGFDQEGRPKLRPGMDIIYADGEFRYAADLQ